MVPAALDQVGNDDCDLSVGVRALELGALKQLGRLYWYTVEFGLIRTEAGLKIYGAGILSSAREV